MNVLEINLEQGMPSCDDAMTYLKQELESARRGGFKCIVAIHGYGSSGKGGKIRDTVRQWLKAQQRNGKVKTVINGEDFQMFDFKALDLKNKYKELQQWYGGSNHGVTVIEL